MAKQTNIAKEDWLAALEATVPARLLDINRQAFRPVMTPPDTADHVMHDIRL